MNTEATFPSLSQAETRVLVMQSKLHRWAVADPGRRFDDMFNLVYDPAFLLVAWDRVRWNRGARTAGVDGVSPRMVPPDQVYELLDRIRVRLKSGELAPLPVRAVQIPKANGKLRRLGIPGLVDRIVQASLKLVLEPIFEADFDQSSYGFRPGRNAHDAVAEIRQLSGNAGYQWVFEADIKACFDSIDHEFLMAQVRRRVKDKRVCALVRCFLKAGVLTENKTLQPSYTGTPQGGILSPLLANIALTHLDRYFRHLWEQCGNTGSQRMRYRAQGYPTIRLIRYADDFVVMVHGTRADAESLFQVTSQVLSPIGLALSEEKTRVVHIDEGLDFLGWRIQRRTKEGTQKKYVYTYPSKKAVQAITDKIRQLTLHNHFDSLTSLLNRLNPVLKGWCNYYRHGSSSRALAYVNNFTFWRVLGWIFARHPKTGKRALVRRYAPAWHIQENGTALFRPTKVHTNHYRYRGSHIPNPWLPATTV